MRTVSDCPVERTLRIIGGKWTLLVLRDLFTGTKRFGVLLASLEGVSPKTLSDRLKELEGEGIITKTVFPEVPPRVEYALTEKGQSLWEILEAMRRWGDRWAQSPEATRSAPSCVSIATK